MKWTREQTQYLRDNYSGDSVMECAKYLIKKPKAVKDKAFSLGLAKKSPRWTPEEISFLKTNYIKLKSKICSKHLMKSQSSIKMMANKLKIYLPKPKKWKKQEITILKEIFPKYGMKKCIELLDFPPNQIRNKLNRLKIKKICVSSLDTNKVCCKCRKDKLMKDFGIDDRVKCKKKSICKACDATKSMMWKMSHPNYQKEYHRKNRGRLSIQEKERLKTDINFRLIKKIRSRVNDALKNGWKSESTMKLLGCSINELRAHLESKFTSGMTWENHGFYGWHIDHIKPCSSFDLTKPDEQKICFHFSNLQPLWAADNLSKGDSYKL